MKCESILPPHIEIQVRQLGVMAEKQQEKVVVSEHKYRRPIFDENGEPDF